MAATGGGIDERRHEIELGHRHGRFHADRDGVNGNCEDV
jgi:hypothetical protein